MENPNQIKIFEYEHRNVEIIFLNDEPLFNPYDIGACLDISKSTIRDHLVEMDDKERILVKNADVDSNNIRILSNRGEVFLREPGVYQLIFKSRKPEAQRFVKWITHEVLPELRKTGSYSMSKDEQILREIVSNAENLLGIRKREIAINQNESWNMKLAKVIWDLSKQKLGTTGELYEELVYLFAEKTGFNINELAEAMGMTRQNYLIKNQEVCKTLYEFAIEHFYSESRQVTLLPFSQKRLEEFKGK